MTMRLDATVISSGSPRVYPRTLSAVAYAAALLLCLCSPRAAETPAGTVIANQGTATFKWNDVPYGVTSNSVETPVGPVYRFQITPDDDGPNPGQHAHVSAGATATFSYLIQNTGNVTDSYQLTVPWMSSFIADTVQFEPLNRRIYVDGNQNGILDAGEANPVGAVGPLAPGAYLSLLVVFDVPVDAVGYSVISLDGISIGDSSVVDSANNAIALVGEDADVKLHKSVSVGVTQPGDLVTYQLLATNVGNANALATHVTVDGTDREGVFVYDTIPGTSSTRSVYEAGSLSTVSSGATRIYSTDGGVSWLTTEPAAASVTRVGCLFTAPMLPAQVVRLSFGVRFVSDAQPGSVPNTAAVIYRGKEDTDRTDTTTNTVLVTVTPLEGSLYIGPNGDPRARGSRDINGDGRIDENDDTQLADGISDGGDASGEADKAGAIPPIPDRSVVIGNMVIFKNTVENTGTVPDVINIQQDPLSNLPSNWIVLFAQSDGVTTLTDSNQDGLPDVGLVPPGGTRNVVVKVRIPTDEAEGDNNGQGFVTVVRASSAISPSSYNLTGNVIAAVIRTFRVWDPFVKEQDAPENPEVGDKVTYSNIYGNRSSVTLTNILIVDTLDDHLTGISNLTNGLITDRRGSGRQIQATGTYNPTTHTCTWHLPEVPPNFEGVVSFDAIIATDTPAGLEIPNVFEITSDQTQAARSSNTVVAAVGALDVLNIEKKANTDTAEIGDPVLYTVEITNSSTSDVSGATLRDTLPRGFRYKHGTAKLDGQPLEPQNEGDDLVWTLGTIPGETRHTLTYVCIVTSDARFGNGVNTAVLEGNFPLGGTVHLSSSARVRVTEGIFANHSVIIGKVFVDQNGNRMQDAAEPGIEGVRLFLEDGTTVVTDREGKYHLEGIEPGTHVLRLDQTTLPQGSELGVIDSANAMNPASRFLDTRFGVIQKANFRVLPSAIRPTVSAEAELRNVEVTTTGTLTKVSIAADRPVTATWFQDPVGGVTHVTIPGVARTTQPEQALLTDPNVESVRCLLDTATGDAKIQIRWRKRTAGYPPVRITAEPDGVRMEAGWEQAPDNDLPDLDTVDETSALQPRILVPSDGTAYAVSDRITVKVAAHLAARFELYVNGHVVPKDQIGRKDFVVKKRLATYEYVAVPLAMGANKLRFEVVNPGESQPRSVDISVFRAAEPHDITVATTPAQLVADGATEPIIAVTVVDANGTPTGHGTVITLEMPGLDILSPDIYPTDPGHQAQLVEGRAIVRVAPVSKAGKYTVRVTAGDFRREAELEFRPQLRDWIVNGVADVGYTHGTQKRAADGQESPLHRTDDRVAVFAKGSLPHDIAVTAGYDNTRKEDDRKIFQGRDPARDYPVYGDDSEQEYLAESRDELYLKLERNSSYAMWGDYETDLDQTQLAAYRRSFTGAKLHLESDYLDADGFFSHNDQAQVKVELRGRGVSGYYNLGDSDVVINSENVVIETRDRFHPEVVLESRSMARYTDYTIDYDRGRILFKHPVASQDVNHNPIYIVVRYEVDGYKAKSYAVYGGRVAAHTADDRFELGVTHIIEESQPDNYELNGVDGTIELTRNLKLHGEYATSRTTDGVSDDAQLLELVSDHNDASFRAWYEKIGDNFENPSLSGSTVGRTTYGLEGKFRLTEYWSLENQLYTQNDADSKRRRHVGIADFRLDRDLYDLTLGGGYTSETSTDGATAPKASPFLRLGGGRQLTERWYGNLFHQHNFGDPDTEQPTRTEATLSYQWSDRTQLKMGVEHRYLETGSTELAAVLGIEQQIDESLSGFQRLRLEDAASGQRVRSLSGLDWDKKLTTELSLGVTAELTETLSQKTGDQTATDDDFWALTFSLSYVPEDGDYSASGRYEVRGSDQALEHLLELGGTLKLDRDHTLFGRNVFTYKDVRDQSGPDEFTAEILMGWAYRPVDFDRLNMISDLQVDYENGTDVAGSATLQKYMLSSEAHYQLSHRWEAAAKYAVKLTDADFAGSVLTTDVKALRVRYDFTDRYYMALGGRMLSQYDSQTTEFSYGAELGVNIHRNVRVALGYNFAGFDDHDLSRGEHWDKGVYIGLTWKFDESIFGLFNRLRGKEDAE